MPLWVVVAVALFTATYASGMEAAADPDALPDLRVARGDHDIAEAWLIDPATRYRHFVLGSDYEAGGLRLRMADGAVVTLHLDERHVFEDRQPRLTDLDGDGRDEIVLVLTSLSEGASLAVYDVSDGAIRLEARTPHIGQPNRWLNPAAIADLDGDGRLDVAFVAMPHLAARLEAWTLDAGVLRQVATMEDASNHRLGSRHLEMADTGDFNGDGIEDIVIPAAGRHHLRLVTFAGGRPAEIDRLFLGGRADGKIEAFRDGSGWRFRVPLETGRTDLLDWRPR